MRLVLALALVALGAVPAAAQQAGDRYGYGASPRAQGTSIAQPIENQGVRPLTWASKANSQAASALPAPAASARPPGLAMAGQFAGRQAWTRELPPTPSARPVTRQEAAYQPFVPQTPYFDRPQQLAALTPPPVRTAPVVQAAPVAPLAKTDRGPSLAGGPGRPAPAPVAPTLAPQVARATPHAGEQVHYYSLHREYGLTPDAIPEPPQGQRYVLMGPPDEPRKATKRDDDTNDDEDSPVGKPTRPF